MILKQFHCVYRNYRLLAAGLVKFLFRPRPHFSTKGY